MQKILSYLCVTEALTLKISKINAELTDKMLRSLGQDRGKDNGTTHYNSLLIDKLIVDFLLISCVC